MARTANPNKDIIDGLKAEAKTLLRTHKDNHGLVKKALKSNGDLVKALTKINGKLEKLGVATIALPEDATPSASAPAAKRGRAAKAETPAPTGKTAAKPASSSAKGAAAPQVKTLKGAGKGKATPAPAAPAPKRGRPARNDERLSFE